MSGDLKFLAFDLGASSGRAVVGFLNDNRLRLEEVHRFGNGGISVGDSLYWDTLRLFDDMKTGLRLAGQKFGGEIAGAGLDTWGVDFGLLGPNDVLIENPHCYRDSRTDGMMEEADKILPRNEIYAQTGIQFMQINTLYHMLALSKQNRWLLDAAKTMLLIPDLFNFWFTGVKGCEFTEATTTQLYNPVTGDWARSLFDALGIPTHFLADIVPTGTVLGPILSSVAEEAGVPRIPFVAPATHDTGSAVAAVPATDDSYAYISSGTWSLMGIESKTPILSREAMEMNFTNEGGVGNTFRVLKNIMGLWLVQECRRTWAASGKNFSFGELAEMAAKAPAFRSLIDPDDASFLKPCDMPENIREFCRKTGQPVPNDEGEVVRTALDSLAMKYRWVLDRLERLAGKRLDRIHIVGGGTQNRLLCQLAADATRRPVIAGPIEATAIGNIVVQAIALGHVGSITEAREIVKNSFEMVTYLPSADSRAEDAYGRFRQLVK
jgi:rhamnulokinase